MAALLDVLRNIGIFLAFLGARFLVLVGVLAILTALFLVGLGVARAARAVWRASLGLTHVVGFRWRRGVAYAPGHTWVEARPRNGVRIGLDAIAERVLGRLTSIRLPAPGTALREGEPAFEVRAGHRHVTLPSPVTGVVSAVNRPVASRPAVVHADPYVRGWLFAVRRGEMLGERLRSGEAARRWFSAEATRLTHIIETDLGVAAADGGELVGPVPALVSDERWARLVGEFLNRTE